MISKANIKQIRSLQQKKFRDELDAFVIEGYKLLEEAIKHAPQQIKTVYTTTPDDLSGSRDLNIVEVTSKELSQISSLRSPQPFVTVCRKRTSGEEKAPLEIALDTVQDPGNMGTILRLAAWFGIKKIVVSHGCVDIYNPKVIQASMGAIFTVDVISKDLDQYLSVADKPVYGAVMNGENVYDQELPDEAILLLGNEGNGISDELQTRITHSITIPRFGSGESLNVAMATGILLSEFKRKG